MSPQRPSPTSPADIAQRLAERTGGDEVVLRVDLELIEAAAVGLGVEDHLAATTAGAQASRIQEVVRSAAGRVKGKPEP